VNVPRSWVALALLVAIPAAAFIFVPTRGPHQLKPLVTPGAAPVEVQADAAGNLFVADSRGLSALNPDGVVCWNVPLGGTARCQGLLLAGDTLLALCGDAADGARHTVLALAMADGGDRWRKTVAGAGKSVSWHVPRRAAGQTCGTVAVVCGGTLTVLNLAHGDLVGQAPLGATVGEPVWVEDSGFVAISDGAGQSVLGFDTVAPGDDAAPFVRGVWRAPANEVIQRLVWQPEARLLVVYGAGRAYVLSGS
jgi:hypothetical protein